VPWGPADGNGTDGPKACWRAASIRPDDSARPAAKRTSAAARPDEQGKGSPQTGQFIMPSRGPAPRAWAATISWAVRASTLSGLTIVAMRIVPRRHLGALPGPAAHVEVKFTASGGGAGTFRVNTSVGGDPAGQPGGGRGGARPTTAAGAGWRDLAVPVPINERDIHSLQLLSHSPYHEWTPWR
jgi:hypothetical protein